MDIQTKALNMITHMASKHKLQTVSHFSYANCGRIMIQPATSMQTLLQIAFDFQDHGAMFTVRDQRGTVIYDGRRAALANLQPEMDTLALLIATAAAENQPTKGKAQRTAPSKSTAPKRTRK